MSHDKHNISSFHAFKNSMSDNSSRYVNKIQYARAPRIRVRNSLVSTGFSKRSRERFSAIVKVPFRPRGLW